MNETTAPADAGPMTRFFEAVNRLDAEALDTLFSADVRYESQDALEPLVGRGPVLDYLRGKFDTIRGSANPALVELGDLDGRPCGILHQDGARRALLVVEGDPAGSITAVDIFTVSPAPASARGTGRFPGLGKVDPKEVWLQRQPRVPRTARLRFVGFALGEPMADELRRAMRRIAGYYPDTEIVLRNDIHGHSALNGPGNESSSVEERRRFGFRYYPGFGVEADGRVVVPWHHPNVAEVADRTLRRLVEPPPYWREAVAKHGGETFPDGLPVCIDRFEGDYDFLSNFGNGQTVYEDRLYPTVENAFQAAKTLSPVTRRVFERGSPDRAKRAGRVIDLRPDWDDVRVDIMHQLLRYKFREPWLRKQLLATGDALLVEGNWWGDQFWGVSRDRGRNELGKLLMRVREELAGGG